MILPGLPSLLLLAYCLVLLPLAALRSARVIRKVRADSGRLPMSREAIWVQTLLSQAILFLLAWFAASSFGFELFWRPPTQPRDIAAAAVALIGCLFIRVVARSVRSAEERQDMLVYALSPRTGREGALLGATIAAASIAEEAAYRGVLPAVLSFMLGTSESSIAISAAAFAVAHATQGFKSGVMIFVVALIMHALVAMTGTLLLAMAVHAIFDVISAALIAREARELDQPTVPEM